MGMEVANYLSYAEEIDPWVQRAAVILGEVQSHASSQRDAHVKAELGRIFNAYVPRFSRDPKGESQAICREIRDELGKFGAAQQTSDALRGGGAGGGGDEAVDAGGAGAGGDAAA